MIPRLDKMMKQIMLGIIDFYRMFLSFDTGMLRVFAPTGACKYNPTCSLYTRNMVEQHGVLQGLNLGFRRFLTCR